MAVRTEAPKAPKVPEIRKGDTVVVLSGRDAGKRGTVERVIRRRPSPRGGRSMFRRGSARRRRQRRRRGRQHRQAPHQAAPDDRLDRRMPKIQQGGILEIAQPMPIGKVMVVCAQLRQADPHRASHAGQRPSRPRLPPVRRAAGGAARDQPPAGALRGRGRAGAPEAVRLRQRQPGAAPVARSSSTSVSARRSPMPRRSTPRWATSRRSPARSRS